MIAEELIVAAFALVVVTIAALWGFRVARTSRADQSRAVDSIHAHFAAIAGRTGLAISPSGGEVLPGLSGRMGGHTVRLTTALIDDLQCTIVVEAPPDLRWRPHRAIHKSPPADLPPAARAPLERLRRRVRRLDVDAAALHCTLVSTEVLVPALPELLTDLVAVAAELPRASPAATDA